MTISAYLILLAFYRKGYISSEDLKVVFQLLDETVSDEELHSKWHTRGQEVHSIPLTDQLFIYLLTVTCLAMIKIAGIKSNDKINFKEFVDFFYKVD